MIHPGQHLHADFGLACGSAFSALDKMERLITSKDGFRSYLVIVDRPSRYKWLVLTKTKHPPLKELRKVLERHSILTKSLNCTIRANQGGELGKSHAFQELVEECGCTYETTGSSSSKQNGMTERPNQDLKRMTRCLLHAANFSSAYWSYAINPALYLLNQTYHSIIGMMPFQAIYKTQTDLTGLKIFGSKYYYKHTKKNQKSLDIAAEAGTFLGYTSTTKNVYVKDDKTQQIHMVLHKSFDKAHMTTPSDTIPPMVQTLQSASFDNKCSSIDDKILPATEPKLQVCLLSDDAKVPDKSKDMSVGYDIYIWLWVQ